MRQTSHEMPRKGNRSNAYQTRQEEIINYANQLLPTVYVEAIGGVETTAEELIDLVFGWHNARQHETFLESLDYYITADMYQRSTKQYRLDEVTECKFKHKYYFPNGIFSLSFRNSEPPVIEFKGAAPGHLFTNEYQQQIISNGHPVMPERFSSTQDICKLFRFHRYHKDDSMMGFDYSTTSRDRKSMNIAVAQAIILWDLITNEIPRPQETDDHSSENSGDSDDHSSENSDNSDDLP